MLKRIVAWVAGIYFSLALVACAFSDGLEGQTSISWAALHFAVAWSIAWTQAGGNMMPNAVYQQYAEAWANAKAKS